MLPIIAIVGRPNVGKSTLFNCLTRTRQALVGKVPGLTRDRQYGIGILDERKFIVVDTGGLGEETDGIDILMEKQAWQAIQEANVILFVVDARGGLIGNDEIIAKELRKLNKPIYVVANKIDGLDPDVVVADFHRIGLGHPHAIAAEHKIGIESLMSKVLANLGDEFAVVESEIDQKQIKVAIVGRPNVGKSTLVNRILGEERVIVYDEPGTTRDSIHINFSRRGKDYILIDTAGIRRRAKIFVASEKFSVIKAMQAIEATNVVLFLFDGSEDITDQDLRLLGMIMDAGKSLVVAVNKWDGLSDYQRQKVKQTLERKLVFLDFVETFFISALHGTGVGKLFSAINRAYISATKELKTPMITNMLAAATLRLPPPLYKGRPIKLRYAHVGGYNPPLIIIHGTRTEDVPANYRKYLERYFREHLRLVGTPLRIEFRD